MPVSPSLPAVWSPTAVADQALVGAVVAGILAALQIEGDVSSPLVLGRALRLHPLVILVSLTVGAVTAGLLGAFLAVPLVGVAVAATAAARHAAPGAIAGDVEAQSVT